MKRIKMKNNINSQQRGKEGCCSYVYSMWAVAEQRGSGVLLQVTWVCLLVSWPKRGFTEELTNK